MPIAVWARRVNTLSSKKLVATAAIVLLSALSETLGFAGAVKPAVAPGSSTLDNQSPRPLSLRISPSVGRAPSDVYIYVSIARRVENRLLRVSANSEGFFRSSEVPLNGEDSARVSLVKFRELPAGGYLIRAELVVAGGRTANVETRAFQIF